MCSIALTKIDGNMQARNGATRPITEYVEASRIYLSICTLRREFLALLRSRVCVNDNSMHDNMKSKEATSAHVPEFVLCCSLLFCTRLLITRKCWLKVGNVRVSRSKWSKDCIWRPPSSCNITYCFCPPFLARTNENHWWILWKKSDENVVVADVNGNE